MNTMETARYIRELASKGQLAVLIAAAIECQRAWKDGEFLGDAVETLSDALDVIQDA